MEKSWKSHVRESPLGSALFGLCVLFLVLPLETLLLLLFKGEERPLVGVAAVVPGSEGSVGPGPGSGAKAKDLRVREKVLTCYCQLQARMLVHWSFFP